MKISSLIKCGVVALLCGLTGCSSTGTQTSETLPTGAEIGEQVSKRTETAEAGETTGVIIASSSDASPKSASAAPDDSNDSDGPGPGSTAAAEVSGPWLRLGDDGTLSDADGETVSEFPKISKEGRIVVRHAATVTPETLGAAIKRLAAAGWTDIRTIVDDDAPAAPTGAGDEGSKKDPAVDAEKNPDDA